MTLVAVSKRQPLDRIREAIDAGLLVLGENLVQEAVTKSAALPPNLDWHLLGPLQSNKAKVAARLFSTFHALDRPKILHALDRHAGQIGRRIDGFLQVNIGSESTKHGFAPEGLLDTVAPFAALENLRIIGLMAIPPYEPNLEDARTWFRRLRELRDRMAKESRWRDAGFPGDLSMGMSHDFEVAIEEGASHVRVGTSLFGSRPG